MGLTKKASLFLLTTTLGFLLVSVFGCASSSQNIRRGAEFESQSQNPTISNSRSAQPAPHQRNILPEEPLQMSPEELERLGDIYLSRNNLHMAFVQYEKSLKLNPDDIRVRYKKGLVLTLGGLNGDAIKEFNGVLRKDPSYALAYEGLGRAYFQMKKLDEAERNLRKAIELNSGLWKTHNYLGLIYDYKRKHGLAIEEYVSAIRLNPHKGILYHNMGVSYAMAGDYERAINSFKTALENRYTDKKVFNNLGLAYCRVGRYEEALEAFKKGGDVAQAYNNLGCVLMKEGRFEKAIKCFEKAIELSPTFYAKANENLKKARMAILN